MASGGRPDAALAAQRSPVDDAAGERCVPSDHDGAESRVIGSAAGSRASRSSCADRFMTPTAGGGTGDLRVCLPPWILPDGGTIMLASNVPGTEDYRDLRRSARTLQLDDGTSVRVAHPRDLLRMADASPRESERARVPGLRALLSHRLDRGGHT
jgi:hypothetical protein